jgi:hypothetical protein
MNKYPGIYKALDGTIYYYLNKSNFFSPERDRWEEDCDNDDHKTDVNITAEYLTNTYGRVESKEHAEFIVKLAEVNGFKYVDEWKEGMFFCICNDMEKGIILRFFRETLAKSYGEKLIAIPLPPKEGEEAVEQTEAKAAAAMRTVIDLGYTYHGGELWKPPLDDVKCNHEQFLNRCSENAESARKALWSDYINRSKEWPAVGDEVLINNLKCNVIGIDGDAYWIKRKKTGTYDIAKREQLKKPPTPEEELRTKLISVMDNSNTAFAYADFISKAIINGEIEGLEYKPQ